MPDIFVYPLRGRNDVSSLRTKEAALEAYLKNLSETAGEPGPPGPQGPPGEAGNDGYDEGHIIDTSEPATKVDGLLWTNPSELIDLPEGPAGEGVPAGGTDGQVLTKTSAVDYETAWETPVPGGGGEGSPHVVDPVEPTAPADGLLWTNPDEETPVLTIAHVHIQSSPASVWTINHPLSFQPNVAVIDSSGDQVEGEVKYLDSDTITVGFSAAFGGTAYLS